MSYRKCISILLPAYIFCSVLADWTRNNYGLSFLNYKSYIFPTTLALSFVHSFFFFSLHRSLSFFWSFAPEWASVSNGNGALNQRSKTSAQQRGQLSKYSGRKCVCVCVTAREKGVGLAGLSLVWFDTVIFQFNPCNSFCVLMHSCMLQVLKRIKKLAQSKIVCTLVLF